MGFFSKAIKGIGRMYKSAFSNTVGVLGIETSHARKKRHKEQDRLTQQQLEAEKEMFDYTLGRQEEAKENWAQKYETPEAKVKLLRQAGLNPALMYGTAGEGGVSNAGLGGQTGGISRGEDTTAEYMNVKAQKFNMAIQAMLAKNQIKVGNSQADKNMADAKLAESKTQTETDSRTILIENMRQAGMTNWYQNLEKAFTHSNTLQDILNHGKDGNWEMDVVKNWTYDVQGGIGKESLFSLDVTNQLLKTIEEVSETSSQTTKNLAEKILADEKTQWLFYEAYTGRMNAETAAKRMSLETGEEWNERQIIEVISQISGTILKALMGGGAKIPMNGR